MYRILYIEDEILNSRLVKKMLKPMGYEILDAETAAQGLRVAARERPDLILMDVNLPDLNGYEATEQLKQSDLAHIPVIVLTADTTSRTYHKCLNAGCDAYLNKPVSASALIRTIHQVVGQKQTL